MPRKVEAAPAIPIEARDAYERFCTSPESITLGDIKLLDAEGVLAHAAEERSLDVL